MILTSLELINFRNYQHLSLNFEKGINSIVGRNGEGKTNIVEAIHYLSLTKSFRTSDDSLLIRNGSNGAYIKAKLKENESNLTVEIALTKDSKKILVNGKAVRKVSELAKKVNVIVFSPSNVPLFMGSPGERRNFLDVSISKSSNEYLEALGNYLKLLKSRNLALKENQIDENLINVYTSQMVNLAAKIVKYRRLFISELNKVLPNILSKLIGKQVSASLSYRPFVKDDELFIERAKKAYLDSKESDYVHKSTSVGPHREDFSFIYEGKDLSDYGSQGENRLCVLALTLSPNYLISEREKRPICVLDDVTSELDEVHKENLYSLLQSLDQCFITGTELNIKNSSIFEVSKNNAKRRK